MFIENNWLNEHTTPAGVEFINNERHFSINI
jgi:hypothetical protein